jgi:hypothetical protein
VLTRHAHPAWPALAPIRCACPHLPACADPTPHPTPPQVRWYTFQFLLDEVVEEMEELSEALEELAEQLPYPLA